MQFNHSNFGGNAINHGDVITPTLEADVVVTLPDLPVDVYRVRALEGVVEVSIGSDGVTRQKLGANGEIDPIGVSFAMDSNAVIAGPELDPRVAVLAWREQPVVFTVVTSADNVLRIPLADRLSPALMSVASDTSGVGLRVVGLADERKIARVDIVAGAGVDASAVVHVMGVAVPWNPVRMRVQLINSVELRHYTTGQDVEAQNFWRMPVQRLGTLAKQPREEISASINYDEWLDQKDVVERVYKVEISPPGALQYYVLKASKDRVRLFFNRGDDRVRYKVTTQVLTSKGEVLEDELVVKNKEV